MMFNEEALKQIAEGAHKLAGEQLTSGTRKGIGTDGMEIVITFDKAQKSDDEDMPPIRRKLKEYGLDGE